LPIYDLIVKKKPLNEVNARELSCELKMQETAPFNVKAR
jgi:hypothetical protein